MNKRRIEVQACDRQRAGRRQWMAGVLVALAGGVPATVMAQADTYPSKPIKLIVPFAPGGSTDLVARLVAEQMYRSLGQPIIVENRAGAGGSIGAAAVARAAPDGYTIGMGTISTLNVNPVLLKTSYKEPLKEFAPIVTLASVPSVFTTHPSLGVKDYAGFVELVRARPDEFTFGTPGVGSIGHILLEAMNHELNIQVRHIPYRGMGPVINGALGGETQVFSDQYPSSASFIRDGRLVPFAVGAPQRLASLPDVPTFKELGHPELNELAVTWFGLVAPAGTPDALVERLNAAAVEALKQPAMQKRLAELGMQAIGNRPDDFRALIASGLKRIQDLVAVRQISVE